jgi:OOP family OmpA-OmpF porin
MHALARWTSLALLCAWILICLVRGPAQIEATLYSRSAAAIEQAGLRVDSLDFDGRQAVIVGSTRQRPALEDAARLVARLPGVRRVKLILKESIGSSSTARGLTPAPLGHPLPSGDDAAMPAYRDLADKVQRFSDSSRVSAEVDAGAVRLAGEVPTALYQDMAAKLNRTWNITGLTGRSDLNWPTWYPNLLALLDELQKGAFSGTVEAGPRDRVVVRGTVENDTVQRVLEQAIVAALPGLRVETTLTVIPSAAGTETSGPTSEVDSSADASATEGAGNVIVIQQEGDNVRVSGRLPDRAMLAELVGAVQSLWGTPYTDYAVEIASRAPQPTWMPAGLQLLQAVKTSVRDATVEYSNGRVHMAGQIASEGVREWLLAEAGRLLPGYQISEKFIIGDKRAAAAEHLQQTVDAVIEEKRIDFELGSAILTVSAERLLDEIAEILIAEEATVAVLGHTDNSGSVAANQKLSELRARVVIDYLVGRGVPSQRLVARGYGATQPLASNDTPAGRRANRRVEFHVEEDR